MKNPQKIVMVGVNAKNGLGYIVPLNTNLNMGNHLTAVMPVNFNFQLANGRVVETTFSYFNKFTNNTVYQEIE